MNNVQADLFLSYTIIASAVAAFPGGTAPVVARIAAEGVADTAVVIVMDTDVAVPPLDSSLVAAGVRNPADKVDKLIVAVGRVGMSVVAAGCSERPFRKRPFPG